MEYLTAIIYIGYFVLSVMAGIKLEGLQYQKAFVDFKKISDDYNRISSKKWASIYERMQQQEIEQHWGPKAADELSSSKRNFILYPVAFLFGPLILGLMAGDKWFPWIVIISTILYALAVIRSGTRN